MGKFDTLKQASENSFSGLYIDNITRTQNDTTEVVKQPKVEVEEVKKKLKMVAFRLPTDIADKINQYAYVERLTSQDVATLCFEEFFNKKSSKEILAKYDEIKKQDTQYPTFFV